MKDVNRTNIKIHRPYSSEHEVSWDNSESSWEWPSKNPLFDYQGSLSDHPAPEDLIDE